MKIRIIRNPRLKQFRVEIFTGRKWEWESYEKWFDTEKEAVEWAYVMDAPEEVVREFEI